MSETFKSSTQSHLKGTTSEYLNLKEAVIRISNDMGRREAERFLQDYGRTSTEESVFEEISSPLQSDNTTKDQADHILLQAMRLISARLPLRTSHWCFLAELSRDAYSNSRFHQIRARYINTLYSLIEGGNALIFKRNPNLAVTQLELALQTLMTQLDLPAATIEQHLRTLSHTKDLATRYELGKIALLSLSDKMPKWLPTRLGESAANQLIQIARHLTDADTRALSTSHAYFLPDWARLASRGYNLTFRESVPLEMGQLNLKAVSPFESPLLNIRFEPQLQSPTLGSLGMISKVQSKRTEFKQAGFDLAHGLFLEIEKLKEWFNLQDALPRNHANSVTDDRVINLGSSEAIFQIRLPNQELELSESQARQLVNNYMMWRKVSAHQIFLRHMSRMYGDI